MDEFLKSLQKFLKTLSDALPSLVYAPPVSETPELAPTTESKAEMLYRAAVGFLGTDASPNDLAPDEYGCAESVNSVYHKAFNTYINPDNRLSTYWMYKALKEETTRFKGVSTPVPGCIVISPTGYGTRTNAVPNGHVGIVGNNETIMSASSRTGTFEQNYTLDSWADRYVRQGGYPMRFFIPL